MGNFIGFLLRATGVYTKIFDHGSCLGPAVLESRVQDLAHGQVMIGAGTDGHQVRDVAQIVERQLVQCFSSPRKLSAFLLFHLLGRT